MIRPMHVWRTWRWALAAATVGTFVASAALAYPRGLSVEVWTDRGNDAVYQPGEDMRIKARTSDDAYLLVYEIDAEGYVRMLYPYRGSSGQVEGRSTYDLPPDQSNLELVVQQATGQAFIVAVASREPLLDLPWYLRPYDAQAENIGYEGYRGEADDEQGVTSEGRIVGDPYVAMERIRRRVVSEPDNADAFATSYTSYYVHQQVRYPRYLCYDCHRPGQWAWWQDFDPYYTSCSVFDFRVNWGWGWGPSYWFGSVPYYYYCYRPDCPPRYRGFYTSHTRYSGWDGYQRWKDLWGDRIVRYKTPAPPGYIPPSKYSQRTPVRGAMPTPPGFQTAGAMKGGELRPRVPIGRSLQPRDGESRGSDATAGDGRGWRTGGRDAGQGRPFADPAPGRTLAPGRGGTDAPRGFERPARDVRPMPRVLRPDAGDDSRGDGNRYGNGRRETPRYDPPRLEPREGRGHDDGERARRVPERAPRVEAPREEKSRGESQRSERPRDNPPREERGGGRGKGH